MSRSLPRPASAPPPPVRRGQLVEARETRSADGTNIAYFVGPEPYPGAPVVVLANGLGGPRLAWRGLVEQLSDEVRFVTWDYRGLYASSRPSDSSDLAYSVPRQVDDLEAVLRAEGIGRATLFGWSMGVQVALEAYRRLPGFAEALVLLNGTFGRPLDTAVPLPFARRFVPPVLQVAERLHQPVGKVMRALAAQPEFVSVMKRFGMMADTVDEGEFTEIAVAFAGLDVEDEDGPVYCTHIELTWAVQGELIRARVRTTFHRQTGTQFALSTQCASNAEAITADLASATPSFRAVTATTMLRWRPL